MKPKMKLKMAIDLLMTILLLLLMAFQITGQRLHEFLGAGMLVLFLLHNILNYRWYKSLFKGKYKPLRIMRTAVNFAVLLSMLCLGFSGIVLSHYVFSDVGGPMATARSMHLAASYWGFVMMSIHLGMHWGMILGMFRKLRKGKRMPQFGIWILRAAAFVFANYGLYCFIDRNILSYMFLQSRFVFIEIEQTAVSAFTELIAMMSLWVFAGYYAAKLLGMRDRKSEENQNGK